MDIKEGLYTFHYDEKNKIIDLFKSNGYSIIDEAHDDKMYFDWRERTGRVHYDEINKTGFYITVYPMKLSQSYVKFSYGTIYQDYKNFVIEPSLKNRNKIEIEWI